MLDKIYQNLSLNRDKNNYTLERMGAYNIIITVMPEIGNNNAGIIII